MRNYGPVRASRSRLAAASIDQLFSALSFVRSQARVLPRRIVPEEYTSGCGETERHRYRVRRNRRRPLQGALEDVRQREPESDADQAAKQTDHDRFDEELQQDVLAARADCKPQADLARSL